MIQFFRKLYFTNTFFQVLLGFVMLLVLSFFFTFLYTVSVILFLVFIVITLLEIMLLFSRKNNVKIKRNYPEKLSNGDENKLSISITSKSNFNLKCRLIEELPIQFQKRDFLHKFILNTKNDYTFSYYLRPTKRGEYHFSYCNVFISIFGFVEKRIKSTEIMMIPCYPSFIQLRKYTLMATTHRLHELGIKKIRKIGTSMEFERIQEYNKGDDYRFINWKATGKLNKLMVNRYEDEKSQPIISLIDTGRAMRMPFEELTLLDYAINSTLVLSNVAISKHDKSGVILFSKKIEKQLPAEKKNHQIRLISEMLYNTKTDFKETEFGTLYAHVRRTVNQRSLLFLYTNFESTDALKRQLKYLRSLNKNNILVVVIFNNTELQELANKKATKIHEIYDKIIAEKFLYEKQLIVKELQSHGIQTILTEPQNLTINSINKYLEIKAKGLL
ncbi:MAG: DUF58 domain-containing protein [Flavobacteriales bacterium]|nr:DUF58 domain-containing protein [Flavobacteriales bacterium]